MAADDPEKIYITGAGGRLGRSVLARVQAIPLVRKASGLDGEIVTGFSLGELKDTLADAKAVIHLAGSMDTLDPRGMREANVELTRRIVEAMPKGCRIIFASSISVYGKRPKETPADESTEAFPDSEYSRSKLEAELIVASCPDHAILRIGTIYGPGYEDYLKVISMIKSGSMRIIGSGENRVPFVHVDDVAKAIEASVSMGSGTYVIAGEPLTQEEIYRIVARETGSRMPDARIGYGTAMFLAWIREIGSCFGLKRPSLTREHIAILGSDRVFDCQRARKELGFSPRPLSKGIVELVQGYRKEGRI